jgi:hypothetical protein
MFPSSTLVHPARHPPFPHPVNSLWCRYEGCAIVDAAGVVLTNISMSDIRGLAPLVHSSPSDVAAVLDEEVIR